MSSYPQNDHNNWPLNFHDYREPAPASNYEDAHRHATRELARAKPIVVAAFRAAAQPEATIARVEAWYDRQLEARSAALGEPIPVPDRRAW
jgi:hypothetical protein